MLLALDPSSNRCGVAIFLDGVLIVADVVTVPKNDKHKCPMRQAVDMSARVALWCADYKITSLVVEWPKIRSATKAKGDPNHNVPLAGVCVGAALALGLSVEACHAYLPKEWTASVPKNETVKGAKKSPRAIRIKSRLHGTELKIWQGVKYHDTIDAIGIGLKYLGRYERQRRKV